MGDDRRFARWGASALVLLLSLLAAVVYTHPLAFHLDDSVPYAYGVSREQGVQALVPGDPLQFYYALALTDDMVRHRGPWFRDPYQFSAPAAPSRKSYFFLPFSLLFAALSPLGRATAYDLLVLGSFPATALAAFWLARRAGTTDLGALVTTAAITLLPYRVANVAGGHPTGITFFLLPFVLLGLEAAWQSRSALAAAGAATALVCLAVNEPHFVFFCAFLIPLWLASALWRLEPARTVDARPAWPWIVVSAIGPTVAWCFQQARHHAVVWTPAMVVALFVVATALLALAWRVGAEIRARAGARAEGAQARSFLPLSILALYPVQTVLEVPHLGAVLALAAGVGVALAQRALAPALLAVARRAPYRPVATRFAILWPAAVGLVGAGILLLQYKTAFIDPAGHSGGRSLREITLFAPRLADFADRANTRLGHELYPGAVVCVLAAASLGSGAGRFLVAVAAVAAALTLGPNAPAWLPLYPAAFHLVPFFSIIRQSAKLFAIVALALGVAAGLGADRLRTRFGTAAVLVALALLLVDATKVLPFGITKLPASNRAYAAIAASAGGSNLLELPLWPGDSAFSSIYLYWATRTRIPMVNGYSPTAPRAYVETVYRPLASMNLGELTEEQDRRLDELGVRFVTLHRDTYPPQVSLFPYRFALAAMRRNPNLRSVLDDEGVHLFERVSGDYRPWDETAPWAPAAFFEAESLKIGEGERTDDADASGGAYVHGNGSVVRPVVFGPYRTLPRGQYRVRFRVRGTGRVEVSTDEGRALLASAAVERAEWTELDLALSTDRPRVIELRGWSREASSLDLDWVQVAKRDAVGPADPDRYEAEDLTALYGGDGESADASAGGYAVVAAEVPGQVVRDGPYRELPPGEARVTLRSRGGVVGLRMESADGLRRLAEWRVPAHAGWQEFQAPLVLARPTIVCARLVSEGQPADVDYVEIVPAAK